MYTSNLFKKWASYIALIFMLTAGNAFAQQSISTEPLPDIGIYQINLEGESGNGGLFYRLEFSTNGSVNIIKKFAGQDHDEIHQWRTDGHNVQIIPLDIGIISDFDKATMVILDEKTISVNLNVPGSTLGVLEKDMQFELYRWNNVAAYLVFFMTLIVLLVLNELFRFVKWSGFVFFGGLGLALTIFVWPNQGIVYWFKWAKLYSVVFASLFFLLMRFTTVHQYRLAKIFCVVFLAGNIGEAVVQDFSMGFTPNILNGLAGALSILTCYFGWKGITADRSPQQDMIWPQMTVLWIIAYDVWNFVYVYINFPASSSAHLMVIIAATIPAVLIKDGTWLQARAYTLAAWFMFYFTFPEFYTRNLLVFPRNDVMTYSLAALSLVLNIAVVVQLVKYYKTQKQPATA
ncbi:MAG: DUF5692 family protein [Moritella sp.]|uniref:DUF5692 family protein n=1 Tax=Moritella sp. TaxID=78556 RepID=UPI0029B433A7|nr:DUF5692 family protein [Moritella sp.]MDX2320217.1 DUF5692 family protein [Moritella sp.]